MSTAPARPRAVVVATVAAWCGVVLAGVSGCWFAPNLAPAGYVACEKDADCEPGRTCGEGVCAPPPWHDEAFEDRRLLVVENADTAPLPQGTAIPVVVGGPAGDLALGDVPPDARYASFEPTTGAWSVISVFLDRGQPDRFTAFIPTQHEVLQGQSDVLAWIESATGSGLPTVVEDPPATFLAFENFEGPLVDTKWRILGSGTPTVAAGLVNVADNQAIVLLKELRAPVTATVVARVNGITCDQVFIGLIADNRSLFAAPPEAGMFVTQDLAATATIAPTAASVPTNVGDGFRASTSFARYTIAVDGGGVRVLADDTVAFTQDDLRPPFEDVPLYLAVQVGGACSVDVDTLWIAPLPLPAPKITAGPIIHFQLFP